MTEGLRQAASAADRDPASLKIVVLGHVGITESPLGEGRPNFVGSLDEIKEDVETAQTLGVYELILSPTGGAIVNGPLDEQLRFLDQMRELV